jgi:hypothetical protein
MNGQRSDATAAATSAGRDLSDKPGITPTGQRDCGPTRTPARALRPALLVFSPGAHPGMAGGRRRAALCVRTATLDYPLPLPHLPFSRRPGPLTGTAQRTCDFGSTKRSIATISAVATPSSARSSPPAGSGQPSATCRRPHERDRRTLDRGMPPRAGGPYRHLEPEPSAVDPARVQDPPQSAPASPLLDGAAPFNRCPNRSILSSTASEDTVARVA